MHATPPAWRRTSAARPRSVDERLVDQLVQLRPDRVGARGQELREEQDDELLGGVDPERRARRSAPPELPGRACRQRGDRVEDDREAEAEADALERRLGEQRPPDRLEV